MLKESGSVLPSILFSSLEAAPCCKQKRKRIRRRGRMRRRHDRYQRIQTHDCFSLLPKTNSSNDRNYKRQSHWESFVTSEPILIIETAHPCLFTRCGTYGYHMQPIFMILVDDDMYESFVSLRMPKEYPHGSTAKIWSTGSRVMAFQSRH